MPEYYVFFRWLDGDKEWLTLDQLAHLSAEEVETLQKDRRQAWLRSLEGEAETEYRSQLMALPRRRARPPALEALIECRRELRELRALESASNPAPPPLPAVGSPVWFWRAQSEEFAKLLVEELNRRVMSDLGSYEASQALGVRFAYIEAESFDREKRALIQFCIDEVYAGESPAVSGSEVASDIARLALGTARRLAKEWEADPDGPVPPNAFQWKGKFSEGLQEAPWRLVNALWSARNRTLPIDTELGGVVWLEHALEPDENQVDGVRTKANRFFDSHEIPFQVAKKAKTYISLIEVKDRSARGGTARTHVRRRS